MEQDQMVKDRAQDAEQETAEMAAEPVHPGKTLSVKIQAEAQYMDIRKT